MTSQTLTYLRRLGREPTYGWLVFLVAGIVLVAVLTPVIKRYLVGPS